MMILPLLLAAAVSAQETFETTARQVNGFKVNQNANESYFLVSPDGKTVAYHRTYQDYSVRLVDLGSGQVKAKLDDMDRTGWGFSADGERFVAGSKNHVTFVDAVSGKVLRTVAVDKGDKYPSDGGRVVVSPDGRYAAGPDQKTLRVWDMRTGRELRSESSSEEFVAAGFFGDWAVGGGFGDRLLFLDVKTGRTRWSQSDPCAVIPAQIQASPDGALLLTANNGGALCLWDAEAGAVREVLSTAVAYGVNALFSPDGSRILALGAVKGEGSDQRQDVLVWEADGGRLVSSFSRRSHGKWAVSRDLRSFASIESRDYNSHDLVIWDVETGLVRMKATVPYSSAPEALEFSLDGELVIAGGYRSFLFETATGRFRVWRDGGSFHSLAATPDGKGFVAGSFSDGYRYFAFAPAPAPEAPKPTGPVKLSAEASVSGPLEAGKTAAITVSVSNAGPGTAHLVRLTPRLRAYHPGVLAPSEAFAGAIEPGRSVTKTITLSALEQLASGRFNVSIDVPEGNGFDGPALSVDVEAKGFEPPKLQAALSGEPLKAGEENVLVLTVTNVGSGRAEGVKAWLTGSAPGLFADDKPVELGALGPGESREARFKAFTNNRFSGAALPLSLGLDDATGKHGFKPRALRLAFGERPSLPEAADEGGAVALKRSAVLQGVEGMSFVVASPDGKRLAASGRNLLLVWDVATGAEVARFDNPNDRKHGMLAPAGFLPDGRLVAFGDNNAVVLDLEKKKSAPLWKGAATRYTRRETGSAFQPYYIYADNSLGSAAVSPDGRLAALGGCYEKDEELRLVELESKQERVLRSAQGCAKDVAFSPDGSLVAFTRSSGTVELWDVSGGGRVASFKKEDKHVYGVAFSPDGKWLAVAAADKNLLVYDLAKRVLAHELAWPSYDVYHVRFSADGKLLAAGAGTIVLYETAGWTEKARLNGNYGDPFAFLPDGRLAVAASNSVVLYSTSRSAASPRPKAPAKLTTTVALKEPSGNRALDGGEKAELEVVVSNAGPGKAHGIRLSATPAQPIPGVKLPESAAAGDLPPGQQLSRRLPLSAALDLAAGRALVKVEAREANGFDAPPTLVEFELKAADLPRLELAGLSLESGVVKPNELNKLSVTLRNAGMGTAKGVLAELVLGDADVFPSGQTRQAAGDLAAGQSKRLSFEFFVNARFKGRKLPISLSTTDSLGLGFTRLPLNLALGEAPKLSVVTVRADDVDEPPQAKTPADPDALAIVIGIERYRQQGLPGVDFASRDASSVHAYLTRSMGFDPKNVVLLQNEGAAKTDLEKYLGAWLRNRATPKSRVLVYYAGHGAPNPSTGEGYLIPYDGDPSYTAETAYSLKRLYESLAELPTKDVTVVLDACFSGQGQRSVIAKGARPLVAVKRAQPGVNTVVLAAATGEQISTSHPEGQHGLMTYYLLKGLRGNADSDGDGAVDTTELHGYLSPEVEREARRQNVEQTPTLSAKSGWVWLKLR